MATLDSKRTEVSDLMTMLEVDLKQESLEKKLTVDQRRSALGKLKVHGRDVNGSDAIFTKDGIKTLGTVALNDTDVESSREALRCIANAMLLVAATRQIFIDHGFVKTTCAKYESDSEDDEFLLARIMFWCTYTANKDTVATWASDFDLVKNISKALERYSKRIADDAPAPNQMMTMAISETLKLMFNVESKLDDQNELFLKDVGQLFKLLRRIRLSTPVFQPPLTHVLNALSEMDFKACAEDIFPTSNPQINAERLVEIIQKATSDGFLEETGQYDFDERGASLLKILYMMYPHAPEDIQKYLQKSLLPTEEDRNKPLGRGSSLSARLLQITTSALAPNTRNLMSALLYRLSDSDPSKFVQNVGYGFASGYLMSQGIPLPQDSMNGSGGAGARSSEGNPINPVTGQTLDTETLPDLPEMTDEEKEREAEKLFVLFERLNKTGVISVENPVRRAQQEGRFEELDD